MEEYTLRLSFEIKAEKNPCCINVGHQDENHIEIYSTKNNEPENSIVVTAQQAELLIEALRQLIDDMPMGFEDS